MSQNISIHPNHILTPCTKSTFITSPNFSHHLAPNLPTVFYFPTLYYYLSVKSGPVPFFCLLAHANPTILLDTIPI